MSEEIINIREINDNDYYKKHLELYKESFSIEPNLIDIVDYRNYIQKQKENVGLAASGVQKHKGNVGLVASAFQKLQESVGLEASAFQKHKENAGLAASGLEHTWKMQVSRHQTFKNTLKI